MRSFLVLALLLGGCTSTKDTIEKEVIRTVYVDRPAPCPAKSESERLLKQRPAPLRSQPMPTSEVERVAQSGAQLGLYEAEGGWADKVISALSRCRVE